MLTGGDTMRRMLVVREVHIRQIPGLDDRVGEQIAVLCIIKEIIEQKEIQQKEIQQKEPKPREVQRKREIVPIDHPTVGSELLGEPIATPFARKEPRSPLVAPGRSVLARALFR